MAPSISVIVPAYNAEGFILEQLDALAAQTYRGEFEVVVADNGSDDRTRELVESHRGITELRVVDAGAKRGAGPARNAGAGAARGELLAFCDADDVVAPDWLGHLASALDSSEFVTGSIDHESLNAGIGATHWHSHVTSVPKALRFKPYALSGNMGIRRSVFDEVGGFPEDLETVGEDVAFSWSVQLAGHELDFVPDAVVAYRHKVDTRSLWRQHVEFGISDVVLYERFRSRGVPRPRLTSVVAAYARIVLKSPLLLFPRTRPSVLRDVAKRVGRIRGSIRERTLYL